MLALEIAFWLSVALLVHTHVIYPLSLWVIARLRGREATAVDPPADLPTVSLIIVAHDEEEVIAHRLRNARDLDYPRDLPRADRRLGRFLGSHRGAGASGGRGCGARPSSRRQGRGTERRRRGGAG